MKKSLWAMLEKGDTEQIKETTSYKMKKAIRKECFEAKEVYMCKSAGISTLGSIFLQDISKFQGSHPMGALHMNIINKNTNNKTRNSLSVVKLR